ncbi:Hachiman antiphage defense system protein HamA [Pseudomonas sp. AN-1]|uniref:Hachiman antiphage defense system protein HamA n=1 Tax=Pseudomonas sp. AN-1 TaxID=3096605 RepID=UPI002A6AE200|nr:Hachiman antiphage defense system protein HamA [Pseudomonas sp. AN-1]WPP46504.1 Hachiman antiphage defense system protein HamA [Pseudomonas sp. AN-1]
MPWTSKHIKWLVDTGERLKTADGKNIEVWELQHQDDDDVLSEWAKHFRNHYCLDTEIDFLRGKRTRSDYLINIKFPSRTSKLGPGIRAGDFGEILISDFIQWLFGYWVPRVRWSSKVVRDESPKGSDVIGFRLHKKDGEASTNDSLFVFESKTKFSTSKINRLQDAINDSAKDHIRIDESLNFIKQKLFERRDIEAAQRIERFQNPVDMPYMETYGAAAIISDECFDAKELASADCRKIPKSSKSKEFLPHPNGDSLVLLVIKGPSMMDLVHELYRRAAIEA